MGRMTKVSFVSEDKMESHASNGGKKAANEDKQMKRYFRYPCKLTLIFYIFYLVGL